MTQDTVSSQDMDLRCRYCRDDESHGYPEHQESIDLFESRWKERDRLRREVFGLRDEIMSLTATGQTEEAKQKLLLTEEKCLRIRWLNRPEGRQPEQG